MVCEWPLLLMWASGLERCKCWQMTVRRLMQRSSAGPPRYQKPMGFEYDYEKNTKKRRKHGIDFEQAQSLWSDPMVVEIPARVTDEPRWVVIGKISSRHGSAVITRRGENIRLVSVRRCRDEEVAIYDSQDL